MIKISSRIEPIIKPKNKIPTIETFNKKLGRLITTHSSDSYNPQWVKTEIKNSFGKLFILPIMRWHSQEIWAFGFSLPDCFPCFYAILLCLFVFSKNYTVALFRITTNSKSVFIKLRIQSRLNRRKKAITVTMQNNSFQFSLPLHFVEHLFLWCIISEHLFFVKS